MPSVFKDYDDLFFSLEESTEAGTTRPGLFFFLTIRFLGFVFF